MASSAATKSSNSKPGRTVWGREEARKVFGRMPALLRKGMRVHDALAEAQKILPADRQHQPSTLQSPNFAHRVKRVLITETKAITAAEWRAASKPAALVKWTEREWALIARRVNYWRTTLHDKRPTPRIVFDAARAELPSDRQRAFGGLTSGGPAALDAILKAHLKRQELLEGLPFDALCTLFDSGPLVEEDPPEEQHEDHHEPEAYVEPETQTAPASHQEAPQAHPALFALGDTAPAGGFTFTVTAGPEVVGLIRGLISEAVTRELPSHMASVLAGVTGDLKTGIASMLNHFLNAKPGEVIATPAAYVPPPAPAPAPAPVRARARAPVEQPASAAQDDPPEHHPKHNPEPPPSTFDPRTIHHVKRYLPLIDVVGLIGPQVSAVKDKLNGQGGAVRFIDADEVGKWKPRGVVILNTKFIGRDAEQKCKSAGVRPIRVHGAADAVLRAIDLLYFDRSKSVADTGRQAN